MTNDEKKPSTSLAEHVRSDSDSDSDSATTTPPSESERRTAQTLMDPDIHAALTAFDYLSDYTGALGLSPGAYQQELAAQAEKAVAGDLSFAEKMLFGQAHALNTMFGFLAARAKANLDSHLGASELFMRLALKAQSQCRTTVETLAEIKNPRQVAFIKQANLAQGHQQVNNGVPVRVGNDFPSNEQSARSGHELPQNPGTPPLTCAIDPPMEAMGKINGAKVPRGKGRIEPQRTKARCEISGIHQSHEGNH